MDKTIYLAGYGAKQALQALQAYNNNLANANTTGFRADFVANASYPVDGQTYPSRIYDQLNSAGSDFTSGPITSTGNKLDVAIKGDGFIAVQNAEGAEAYTRAGNFQVTNTGLLVTATGKPVLGNQGPISIPPAQNISIGSDGSINVQLPGQGPDTLTTVDRIKLVKPDVANLTKGQDGLFYPQGDGGVEADATVRVANGALEGSNVNTVDQLVHLIDTSRNFETQIKMLKTFESNADAASEVIRLS